MPEMIQRENKIFVYSLSDPRTNEIRYIGKSVIGLKRPRQLHHAHCRKWELLLIDLGLEKQIDIIEELSSAAELDEAERFWIGYFKMIGANLTNVADGGEGGATRRGMKNSEWHRERLSWKGRHHSEKTIKLLSDQKRGKKQTSEFVEKRVAPLRGRKQSDSARKNSSEGIKAYWQSERSKKHRETISARMKSLRAEKTNNA